MLTAYQQRTRLLLKDEKFLMFNDFDIADFINTARGQIAGEAECIRVYGTLILSPPTQQYLFKNITLGTAGVQGVINLRMMTYQIPGTTGEFFVHSREWEFFNTFVISNPVPIPGAPTVWSQFGQGVNGTFFVNIPDLAYVLSLDTVCYPSALASDTDFEAIPYLWTDAVPYFAAYLALLTNKEDERADAMLKLYQTFMQRARQFATASVLPGQYSQSPDPMVMNRLGIQMKQAG